MLLKATLLLVNAFPFNSDEAIVALMARHIGMGERPVFFYGQAYMGSLDAYLVAAFFAIFGQKVWVIRLVQCLLYAGTLATTYLIARKWTGSSGAGLVSAGLLALPPIYITLYSTISLGGYGEALLIGNFIILTGNQIGQKLSGPWKGSMVGCFCILGGLIGIGLWANALTLVYSVPVCFYIFLSGIKQRKSLSILKALPLFLVGFFLGSLPWWGYAARYGLTGLLQEITGSAVAVETTSWLGRSANHLFYFIILGIPVILGIRPSWNATWLVLPLIPVVLIIWGFIFTHIIKQKPQWTQLSPGVIIPTGIISILICGYVFTSFGVDPSGRYFLPVSILLAIWAGDVIWKLRSSSRKIWWIIPIVLSGYNLGGLIQTTRNPSTGLTTQFDPITIVDHQYDRQLIQFLESQNEVRGYTNYWIAYPLAFMSQEEMIFIPRLPYHEDFRYTRRDDRYEPYDRLVSDSPKIAYITSNHPELNQFLRRKFAENGLTWSEKKIGNYQIFYHLSGVIRPEDIGLGTTQ